MSASTIDRQPEPGRSLEQRTMRMIYLRLLPFAGLIYLLCYLDRINVGFAALTMNEALGLDASRYPAT
jgi:ACS family tartrate transporter-like MFS transporter